MSPSTVSQKTVSCLLLMTVVIVNGDVISRSAYVSSSSCYHDTRSAACQPQTRTDDILKSIVYERLFSKFESVQMDLRIIQGELSCPLSPKSHLKLFNSTMNSLAIVSNTRFEDVLYNSQVNCSLKEPCVHCAGMSPCSEDCSQILSTCLGSSGLKFVNEVWKELIDNLRTSLRILLSQYPCTLQDMSLLSKLHSNRDLSQHLTCGSATTTCFNIVQPHTSPVQSRNNLPQLVQQYEHIGNSLRQHWPTSTTSVQTFPVQYSLDDLLEAGSGESDSGSGGHHLKDITDDEDLLSEFGSGRVDNNEIVDSSSTKAPTTTTVGASCCIVSISWLVVLLSSFSVLL